MKSYAILLLVLIALFSCKEEPEVRITPVPENEWQSSMRGLYAVNEQTIWASGTNGVVMRISDKGEWISYRDTSLRSLDFRDVHAFNDREALIMSSGDGCEIYRTANGGESWLKVYENKQEGIFFDGMDFWDDQSGIAFGDPINGQFYLITTADGGKTWQNLEPESMPAVLHGEAGFAASGTGINCVGENTVFIGSGGGEMARVFKSTDKGKNWKVYNTPIRSGEASGIYSMVIKSEKEGIVIGGNYIDSANTEAVCAYTVDGGETWSLSNNQPTGYRSCIAYNGKNCYVSCGRNGIDLSVDDGKNWKNVSKDAYYSCVINNSKGWLTGKKGKTAIIELY